MPGAVVGVYPRPCGGALRPYPVSVSAKGLSPPVRGSRSRRAEPHRFRRSIPARAGEPRANTSPSSRTRVYPRPCGGAGGVDRDRWLYRGLSPPVRGSQVVPSVYGVPLGSIPARAGEPRQARRAHGRGTVYPRPCGGAGDVQIVRRDNSGLSPPVRGSLRRLRRLGPLRRSIPARAGEPKSPRS